MTNLISNKRKNIIGQKKKEREKEREEKIKI